VGCVRLAQVLHRELTTDLAYVPIVEGRAIAIVGESVRASLPAALRWLPLSPPARFGISLLTRRKRHSPALTQLLQIAAEAAAALGWLRPAP
jgi:hypothetical protein